MEQLTMVQRLEADLKRRIRQEIKNLNGKL